MRKKIKVANHTTVRLTFEAEKMCLKLMEQYGINRTKAIEIAVRKWASLEGITKADLESVVLPEEIVE